MDAQKEKIKRKIDKILQEKHKKFLPEKALDDIINAFTDTDEDVLPSELQRYGFDYSYVKGQWKHRFYKDNKVIYEADINRNWLVIKHLFDWDKDKTIRFKLENVVTFDVIMKSLNFIEREGVNYER